jgi:hypothetical protein
VQSARYFETRPPRRAPAAAARRASASVRAPARGMMSGAGRAHRARRKRAGVSARRRGTCKARVMLKLGRRAAPQRPPRAAQAQAFAPMRGARCQAPVAHIARVGKARACRRGSAEVSDSSLFAEQGLSARVMRPSRIAPAPPRIAAARGLTSTTRRAHRAMRAKRRRRHRALNAGFCSARRS